MTFGTSHQAHEADSLLPAIMSLKKLTWYYWSQNRFGNLLPFLASPIRGIKANFYAQVYLRHVCGFLSIFMVLQLVGDRPRYYEQFFVAVLTLLFAADHFVGAFFNPALSQPVSCAVFALGLWLLDRRPRTRIAGLGVWFAVTAVFWVAFFVNLSLVLLVVPLGLACWLLRIASPLGDRRACAALLVAAPLAWLHAQQFFPQTPSTMHWRWDALDIAVLAVVGQINLTSLAAMLVGGGVVAGLARRFQRSTMRGSAGNASVPVQHLALLAALALTSIVLADTDWVRINLFDARYFNVIQLFAVVLPACWFLDMMRSPLRPGVPTPWTARLPLLEPSMRLAWRFGLPLATLLAVLWQAGPPGRLTFVTEAKPDPFAVNADIPAILAHVPAGPPMIVVGKYWTAIPLVFTRLGTKGGSTSYAAVFHWEPMIPEISKVLQSAPSFTLVCLPPFSPDCLTQALTWSGTRSNVQTRVLYGPAPLGDGGSYMVFAATNRH